MLDKIVHNGIVYKQTNNGGVITFDGGSVGGIVKRLPNGMYHARIGEHAHMSEKSAEVFKSIQDHQRKKFQEASEFVDQYLKEIGY